MTQYTSLLFVILLCVASSNSTKVVEVDVICKEALKPSFCSQLLNSKPGGAKGVDLVNLAQYTMDVLHANLTNSVDMFEELIRHTNNNKTKNHYYNCVQDLGPYGHGALAMLRDAEFYLKRGGYTHVAGFAAGIMQDILNCINDDRKQYHDNSLVSNYVKDTRQVGQVLEIISKYLNLG
jgi:pectinesterase inhibitor-like protein